MMARQNSKHHTHNCPHFLAFGGATSAFKRFISKDELALKSGVY